MKKLIILDLNGVLIHRVYKDGLQNIYFRPGIKKFIRLLFKKYDVAVWSCCNKYNTEKLTTQIFGKLKSKLVFIYNRNNCSGKSKKEKVLDKVWNDWVEYDKHNTLIIDDTPWKTINNPKEAVYNVTTWVIDDFNGETLNDIYYKIT